MKLSVKFIAALSVRRTRQSASMLLRRGIRVVRRQHAIVDTHRRTILQFDLAAGDHLDPRIESGEDRDLIAAGRTGGHKRLLDDQRVRRYWRWSFARLLGR